MRSFCSMMTSPCSVDNGVVPGVVVEVLFISESFVGVTIVSHFLVPQAANEFVDEECVGHATLILNQLFSPSGELFQVVVWEFRFLRAPLRVSSNLIQPDLLAVPHFQP